MEALNKKKNYVNDDDRNNTEIIAIHILLEKYIFLSGHNKTAYKCKIWWIYLKMNYINIPTISHSSYRHDSYIQILPS